MHATKQYGITVLRILGWRFQSFSGPSGSSLWAFIADTMGKCMACGSHDVISLEKVQAVVLSSLDSGSQ